MTTPSISLSFDSLVATAVLERPLQLNAIDARMLTELSEAIDRVRASDVHVLIVTGAGGNFCAGADLLFALEARTEAEAGDFVGSFQDAFDKVAALPIPVIAAIEGIAVGGGFELALACDLRIVGEEARLGLPEVRIGALAAAGGTYRLRRSVGDSLARYLLLTGELASTSALAFSGLFHEIVPSGTALDRAGELAKQLAEYPPRAVAAVKRALARDPDSSFERRLAREINSALFTTHDRNEGMQALLDKRSPRFEGR